MNQTRTKSRMAADKCRKRVSALLKSLPGARAVPLGRGHLSLEARGKRFGWFLDDHHGDGRIALNLKAPTGAGQRLAEYAPDRFHVPRYLGQRGWVGIWLDPSATDWVEIKELIESAYQLTPPRRQAKNLQSTISNPKPWATFESVSARRKARSA